MTNRRKFDDLPPAQQAGILCNDPRFQTFAALRSGFPGLQFSTGAAAEYLRNCCSIASRAALATDTAALIRFHQLRAEFDAWTGKLGSQRG